MMVKLTSKKDTIEDKQSLTYNCEDSKLINNNGKLINRDGIAFRL